MFWLFCFSFLKERVVYAEAPVAVDTDCISGVGFGWGFFSAVRADRIDYAILGCLLEHFKSELDVLHLVIFSCSWVF